MPISHAIGLLFFAVTGVFCAKVLLYGLRHDVIRPRYFYGALTYRHNSPGDYWYDVAYWSLYTAVCFGFIFLYFYDPGFA